MYAWTGLCEIDVFGIHSCNLIEQEFNYGVECVLLISFSDNASRHAVEEALDTLRSLIAEYSSFIVQATQGIHELKITQLINKLHMIQQWWKVMIYFSLRHKSRNNCSHSDFVYSWIHLKVLKDNNWHTLNHFNTCLSIGLWQLITIGDELVLLGWVWSVGSGPKVMDANEHCKTSNVNRVQFNCCCCLMLFYGAQFKFHRVILESDNHRHSETEGQAMYIMWKT